MIVVCRFTHVGRWEMMVDSNIDHVMIGSDVDAINLSGLRMG